MRVVRLMETTRGPFRLVRDDRVCMPEFAQFAACRDYHPNLRIECHRIGVRGDVSDVRGSHNREDLTACSQHVRLEGAATWFKIG